MTAAPAHTGFAPGAIYRYDPDGGETHCREGVAYADKRGVLVDAFWGLDNHDPMVRHVLTAAETSTATFQFALGDLRPAQRYEHFEFYPEGTVFAVPSQHGLRVDHFIVPGTTPSRERILARAREDIASASEAVEDAVRRLRAASAELARLEAGAADQLVAAYTVEDRS